MRAPFSRRPSAAPWLAVEITDEAVRAAQVVVAPDRRSVSTFESLPLESTPEDGLQRLRRRLPSAQFRCLQLLGLGQYQIQLTDAPAVPANELKDAVRWKLKDLLDYPVDRATIDVVNVPADPAGVSRTSHVLAVSARNEIVGEQMRRFRDSRFPLHAIDIPEMAQRNVAALFEEAGRALAVLAFNQRGGVLTFTSGGELFLSRHSEITPVQLASPDAEVRDQAYDRLILELQRSIDHFDRQFSYVSLSRLLVVPHGVPGLVAQLAGSVDLPVEELALTDAFDFSATPALQTGAAQAEAMHLLGAALRLAA